MNIINFVYNSIPPQPANLLISAEGRLKIADFGLSRISEGREGRQYSHQVATRWYRAPELLYGSRSYTEGVDLWAVGCIFGELLNNCPLFPGENDIDQLGIVIRNLGTPAEKSWPGASCLPDYSKITFPDCQGVSYEDMVPEASVSAVNLLSKFVSSADGATEVTEYLNTSPKNSTSPFAEVELRQVSLRILSRNNSPNSMFIVAGALGALFVIGTMAKVLVVLQSMVSPLKE